MIYIIGDSHVRAFDGKGYKDPEIQRHCGRFTVYWIGPRTAHQLRDHDLSVYLEKTKGHPSLLVFGEIDCRWHIYNKAVQLGHTVQEGIENTIARYLGYLAEYQEKYDIRVLTVCPAASMLTGAIDEPPELLGFANYQQRIDINIAFNVELKRKASVMGIPVVDIFGLLSDRDGRRLTHLAEDFVHFKYTVEIFESIERQISETSRTRNT